MDLRINLNNLDTPEDIQKLTSIIAELADSLDVLYTADAPNGLISARQGRIALYKNGLTYEQWQNVDGGNTWTRIDYLATVIPVEVPSGIICMWSGTIATIPTGWVLCNGANSTPDLRDRFIVGATQDDSGVAKTNVTGALTVSGDGQMPAHTHAAGSLAADSDGAHTHKLTAGTAAGSSLNLYSNSNTSDAEKTTSSDGAHTHTISGSSGSIGSGTKNIAVYYALAFIMKS